MSGHEAFRLPSGWEEKPISQVTIRTKQRDPRRTPHQRFRYVDVSSISRELFKITSPTELLGADAPSRARKEIQENDVLFATVRPTLSRIAIVPAELNGEIASTGYCVLRSDPEQLDPRFLYFYLLTDHFNSHMAELERGVSYPAVNDSDVTKSRIPLPPLSEQKAISHSLSAVQRAIEAQEHIIQTTTELKQALMQKLFSEGLRGEPQKETEIGLVPESWEVMELGEYFQIKHGFAFDGEFFKPSGDYVLMTPGHLHEEGGFRDQGEKTKYLTGDIPQEYVLAKDDLVVAMTEQKSGLLGSAAFVPEGNRYLHNQRLGLIINLDTKRLCKGYLFHVFNLPLLRVEVAKTSTGSKVKHTSPTKLRAVKVPIPPTVEEQEEIASALSATQEKINIAKNRKRQLHDIFDALLHELMTAKTRVHQFSFSPSSSSY